LLTKSVNIIKIRDIRILDLLTTVLVRRRKSHSFIGVMITENFCRAPTSVTIINNH